MTIKLIANSRPTPIHCATKYTPMAFVDRCGEAAYPNMDDIVLRIRRAGCCEHVVQYCPSHYDHVENLIFFTWDEFIYDLEPGRYIADLYDQCNHIGYRQLELHPSVYRTMTPVKETKACYEWPCEVDLGCFEVDVVSDYGEDEVCEDCVDVSDRSLTKGDNGCVTVSDELGCG